MRLIFNHGESRVDPELVAGTRIDMLLSTYKPALHTFEGAIHLFAQNDTARRVLFVNYEILLWDFTK
jgi:hypothetical protein